MRKEGCKAANASQPFAPAGGLNDPPGQWCVAHLLSLWVSILSACPAGPFLKLLGRSVPGFSNPCGVLLTVGGLSECAETMIPRWRSHYGFHNRRPAELRSALKGRPMRSPRSGPGRGKMPCGDKRGTVFGFFRQRVGSTGPFFGTGVRPGPRGRGEGRLRPSP